MIDQDNITKTTDTAPDTPKPKRRKPLWLRVLLWVLGIGVGLCALVCVFISLAVWYLTPPKLTPIVERMANEYLDADVSIGRVQLTYWSTFPWVELRVDSISAVSHSLDKATAEQRAQLPANADSLLSIKRLEGKVDLPALIAMKVKLRDIVIDTPRANVVIVNDSINNFSILPPSQSADTTSSKIPDITLNRFTIEGGMHVAYVSLADTTRVNIQLAPTSLVGEKAPVYDLKTQGDAQAHIGSIALPESIAFGFNGDITWSPDTPRALALDNCDLSVGPVNAQFNTRLNFEHDFVVEAFDFVVDRIAVDKVIDWLPEQYTSQVKGIDTDMTVALQGRTLEPWTAGSDKIPSAEISLNIPPCRMSYRQMTLDRLELIASARYDSADPHKSVVDIDKITMIGEGIGINFKGTATDLLRDPLIDGTFRGGIDFKKIPASLMQMLPFTLKGDLRANAKLRLRPSYLDRNNFHRLNIKGEATLKNFILNYNDSSGSIYTRFAQLKFGSNSTVTNRRGERVDSLLTASVTLDTLAYSLDSQIINSSKIQIKGGISNKAASADTLNVVPLAVSVRAERLRYLDTADSSRVVLRNAAVLGTVQRYKDSKRLPLLSASVKSDVLRYVSKMGRVTLREPAIRLRCHPNSRPRMGERLSVVYDSLKLLHPTLRSDSLLAMARREQRAQRLASGRTRRVVDKADSTSMVDLRADRETRSLLQWWDASGSVKAKSGRLMTPYYPLRNSLSDLDITFDTDTLKINSCNLRLGRSDMAIKGRMSNYTNAMLRRGAVIDLRLSVSGDTLDINQLADAAFYGASYAEKNLPAMAMGEDVDDSHLQAEVDASAADSVTGPLLVPMNVDARFSLRSKVAMYEGLTLHNFRGVANMREGALQLRDLSATTDAGSVRFNALYSAPNISRMELGFGLQLKNFYIERFARLFPQLDSIMPILNTLSGRINCDMAATTSIEPNMDLNMPSLNALMTLRGDSLVVIDPDTYKTVAKWLMFKNKQRNMIDSVSTQIAIHDNTLELYPFIFNFDRYKLGVMGHNDLAMNLDYHVSVLKSPIPFKFGVNIKGTPDNMKIRMGGAKVKENMVVERVQLVNDTRVNLMREMDNAFMRGMRNARLHRLRPTDTPPPIRPDDATPDTISAADSLMLIKEGLLPGHPAGESDSKHRQ